MSAQAETPTRCSAEAIVHVTLAADVDDVPDARGIADETLRLLALARVDPGDGPDVRVVELEGQGWRGRVVAFRLVHGPFVVHVDAERVLGALPEDLTPRERVVAGLGRRKLSNEAIGVELGIDVSTVRTHLRSANRKSRAGGGPCDVTSRGRERVASVGSWRDVLAAAGLTERQVEVGLLAAEGMTRRQIAEALRISCATVGCHVNKVLGALGVTRASKLASRLDGLTGRARAREPRTGRRGAKSR